MTRTKTATSAVPNRATRHNSKTDRLTVGEFQPSLRAPGPRCSNACLCLRNFGGLFRRDRGSYSPQCVRFCRDPAGRDNEEGRRRQGQLGKGGLR